MHIGEFFCRAAVVAFYWFALYAIYLTVTGQY